jgi:hypothetical protein
MRRVAVACLLVAALGTRAEAWNPVKSVTDGLKAVGRGVGKFVGATAGNLVDAIATPSIHDLEDSGHRLVNDASNAVGHEIDHAGSVTAGIVANVNVDLATRLDQVDHSLGARIVQVKTGVDDTVDRAFGRLDRSIGRLDAMARARIAQAGKLVDKIDKVVTDTLAQADDILARRTEDVRELVGSAIDSADRAAAARIAQLDEVAGRRLGNLDTIATKQSLGLEAMLVRVASLIGLVAFLAFVLWRLFVEASHAWKLSTNIQETPSRLFQSIARASPRFFLQLALAAIGVLLLMVVVKWLPHDAEARAQAQIKQHSDAFTAAWHAHDLEGVRFHEAQLELLSPGDTAHYRGLEAKLKLVRDVFTRPARLESLEGLKDIEAQVDEVEALIGTDDPDVMIVKAYVLWQVGASRKDEHEAAQLCAQALDAGASKAAGDFLLAPLARNYLRAFLQDPFPGADVASLQAALDRAGPDGDPGQFAHLVEYDRLLATLDGASQTAYLDMLSAQADLELAKARDPKAKKDSPEAQDARTRRNDAAIRLVTAWRDFDDGLASSPHLADDPAALAAFGLDDAVLAHALFFMSEPKTDALPPMMMSNDPAATPMVRAEMAPVRIEWERRYAPMIGPRARDVLDYQEAQRFKLYEARDAAFEHAYVTYLVASRGGALPKGATLPQLAADAAQGAADLGLYRATPQGRVTEAQSIFDALAKTGAKASADVTESVATSYDARRLRFL